VGDEVARIGIDGSLSLGQGVKTRLAEHAGEYRVHEGPGGMVMMTRLAPDGRGRGRVLMMGEIISRMTVVEVINVVTSTNWRGELHIVGPLGRRVLTVDQGALKHAQTDFETERLGEVLVRAGLIPRADLVPLLAQKSPEQRFGQLLVSKRILDPGTLFKQLQNQAETIFYASLLEERGAYWFVAPPEDAPAPPTTVHLQIQGLLMEGVQRIDEMALYRERIPHNRFFPTALSEAPKSKLDALEPEAQKLFGLCDGARNIDDLARESGLGEFPTLKALYHLSRASLVTLRRGPTVDAKAAQKLVRQFNDIVRDVFMVVATFGKMEGASRALSSWLETSPHASVLGSRVDIDGTLDSQAIAQKLEESGLEDPMQALHQALHELAAYALFTASGGLPRHEEQALARDINHRLKQLRL
jgi:hypothetical protein